MLVNKVLAVAAFVVATVSPALSDDFKQRIHTTPDVIPPSLGSAGTHPCLIATSAGIGFTGFGVAGGSGHVDEGCETRNYAALLHNMGHPEVATAFLCMTNPEVESAFSKLGIDCYEKDHHLHPTEEVVYSDPTHTQLSEPQRAERIKLVFRLMDGK